MFKIAVMVSGSGSNLQAILDHVKSGGIRGAEVALVISDQAQAYALTRAKENGIPGLYIKKDPKAVLKALKEHGIDLIVLAGYLSILEPELIEAYDHRILNIHPSLIPKYSGKGFYGMHVHRAVIAAGEKESGATVHYVDAGIDTGQIILQRKVAVSPEDTAESLQKKVLAIEHQILPEAIQIVLKRMEESNESNTERI